MNSWWRTGSWTRTVQRPTYGSRRAHEQGQSGRAGRCRDRGGSGVGELLARKLSARGAKVALVGLEADALKQVSERLHTESQAWYADVTDHEAMSRVAAEVKERFGKVDIVVANAGVASGGPFVDSDPESWRRVIEVNLIGSAVTARAFLPVLTESRGTCSRSPLSPPSPRRR